MVRGAPLSYARIAAEGDMAASGDAQKGRSASMPPPGDASTRFPRRSGIETLPGAHPPGRRALVRKCV